MILSIIIPVYKVEKYVERCLVSCTDQDIPDSEYELVVVNDGSPDRSLEIVEKFAKGHPNVKVLSQENAGQSAARNAGMKVASGEYFMFVDSDDRIDSNCLGRLTCMLKEENPDALVYCAADDIDGRLKLRRTYPFSSPTSGKEYIGLGAKYCSNITFAIWRSDFLKKYDLEFCEGVYHEDNEFAPRAFYLAGKVSYFNEVVYHVTINTSSTTRGYNPKRSFDLVNVVCPNLSVFCREVCDESRNAFDKIISVCINNAYDNIVSLPKGIQKEFNETMRKKTSLFVHMTGSRKLKYRVEAVLFRLFPKHTVQVYKTMQLFNI